MSAGRKSENDQGRYLSPFYNRRNDSPYGGNLNRQPSGNSGLSAKGSAATRKSGGLSSEADILQRLISC